MKLHGTFYRMLSPVARTSSDVMMGTNEPLKLGMQQSVWINMINREAPDNFCVKNFEAVTKYKHGNRA